MSTQDQSGRSSPSPVRIPANIELPDKILAGLTARQLLILTAAAAVAYLGWWASRGWMPVPVLVGLVAPVVLAALGLAIGHRDGLAMDAFVLAAIRHLVSARRLVAAGPGPNRPAAVPAWLADRATAAGRASGRAGPLVLPVRDCTADGLLGLGRDGLAVVAAATTVNFALRTPPEQQALVGVFARWLHTLTGPAQVLIRAERVDLTGHIDEIEHRAPHLPHPALEAAARDHVAFLDDLAAESDLLTRQVLVVLREPGAHPDPDAAGVRLAHRIGETRRVLSAAGITLTLLDPTAAHAVLRRACDPAADRPATPVGDWAAPGAVITTAAEPDDGWGEAA